MTAVPEKELRRVFVPMGGREVEAKFSTNGLCTVEEEFGGQSLETIGKQMEAGGASFAAVRAIFRAALFHDAPELSPVQAGRVLQEVGTEFAGRVIQQAFDNWKAGELGLPVKLPDLDAQARLAFEVGNVRYVLAFGFNAMAEIEPAFPGMSMPQIAAELAGGGVSVMRLRAMFRAALIDWRETSLFEAGELMDVIGLATVSEAVGKAFIGAFPKVPANDGDQGGEVEGNRTTRRAAAAAKKANPTKPRPRKGGTGKP